MDIVTLIAAIAAISAVSLIVSTIVNSSRAASTHDPALEADTVPADPQERDLHNPNRARGVQLGSLIVLVISGVVLVVLLM